MIGTSKPLSTIQPTVLS